MRANKISPVVNKDKLLILKKLGRESQELNLQIPATCLFLHSLLGDVAE